MSVVHLVAAASLQDVHPAEVWKRLIPAWGGSDLHLQGQRYWSWSPSDCTGPPLSHWHTDTRLTSHFTVLTWFIIKTLDVKTNWPDERKFLFLCSFRRNQRLWRKRSDTGRLCSRQIRESDRYELYRESDRYELYRESDRYELTVWASAFCDSSETSRSRGVNWRR